MLRLETKDTSWPTEIIFCALSLSLPSPTFKQKAANARGCLGMMLPVAALQTARRIQRIITTSKYAA